MIVEYIRQLFEKKTYGELEKENESLKKQIEGLLNLRLKSLEVTKDEDGNEGVDMSFTTAKEYLLIFAAAMAKAFEGDGGINYVQYEVFHEPSGHKFFLTLQRSDKKSPHQLRKEAELELDAALVKIISLRQQLKEAQVRK